ncbi:hypothetical protein FC72_GL000239 [Companilactobacillus tucceti DSM 20183]|uniref:Uncharacterized protein n=1 Tax=Companilactobacillus tucceti DSM 20183 TaxID=1423811 RepID=A0A0R1JDF5_9LACO|nr:hypothetical protein [Companilactobacillus tucceti]KRK65794.1 hypothetical protein FC72_GL000239 [Companilactobacillus tucceti DSM 20183]
MFDLFLRFLKWFLIVAVALAIFFYIGIPLLIMAAVAFGIYYLYKRYKASRYTPEGRKKVN